MPTKFVDGPAAGKVLMLSRAPLFLRVVIDAAGKVDALDKLDDKPAAGERVFAYRMVPGTQSSGFVDGRDPKTGKRWGRAFAGASYRQVTVTECVLPTDAELRDNAAWARWCEKAHAEETKAKGDVSLEN